MGIKTFEEWWEDNGPLNLDCYNAHEKNISCFWAQEAWNARQAEIDELGKEIFGLSAEATYWERYAKALELRVDHEDLRRVREFIFSEYDR